MIEPNPPSVVTFEDSAFRGDTVLFEVAVTRNGAPADLNLGLFWCTGKWRREDADADALFQVTAADSPAGIITLPSPGVLHVHLRPAASANLPADSPVQVDVQWLDPAGDVWTVASGVLTFVGDVTRATV